MLKLYLDMAQVSIKQDKPRKAIFFCNLILDIEPENVKAMFRYGICLRTLGEYDRARSFLLKAYKLAPGNKDILDELDILLSKF